MGLSCSEDRVIVARVVLTRYRTLDVIIMGWREQKIFFINFSNSVVSGHRKTLFNYEPVYNQSTCKVIENAPNLA